MPIKIKYPTYSYFIDAVKARTKGLITVWTDPVTLGMGFLDQTADVIHVITFSQLGQLPASLRAKWYTPKGRNELADKINQTISLRIGDTEEGVDDIVKKLFGSR